MILIVSLILSSSLILQSSAAPAISPLVCGLDGQTYVSKEGAFKSGALVAYPGQCNLKCPCQPIWQPICGSDNTTYASSCYLACSRTGAKALSPPGTSCSELHGCACSMIYAPICGADNTTHSSASCAACQEVPVKSQGECPLPPLPLPSPPAPSKPRRDRSPPPSPPPPLPSPSPIYTSNDTPPASTPDGCASGECYLSALVDDPTCLVSVAKPNTFNQIPLPANFPNPCFASCEAGATDGDKYYKGICNRTCDQRCNATAREGGGGNRAQLALTTCCEGGVELPSLCYASCLKGWSYTEASKRCYPGPCRASRAIELFHSGEGRGGALHADCIYNLEQTPTPCQTTKCKPRGFSCVQSSYTSFYRFTYNLDFCAPLWLNNTNGDLFSTCPPTPATQTPS